MNRTISTWKRTGAGNIRRGFTLVELLVVITIIGILVGLTIPAVFGVRAAFERSAVKFEVDALNDAIEKYRTKTGDYPPDGSSWPVMERHFRKAFPNALNSELSLMNPANTQMDRAEALVFFLGGFSTDAQRPFTGKGGPFVNVGTMAAPSYQYNVSRENTFFEFPTDRLTLDPSGTISSDETLFAGAATSDLFPAFMSRNNRAEVGTPYVYFDSRTYFFNIGPAAGPIIYNCYQPSNIATVTTVSSPRGDLGAVRPHLASVSATGSFVFENSKTFQIITAGKDKRYGGRLVGIGQQWFNLIGQSYTYNGTGMVPDAASANKFVLTENNGILEYPAYDNSSNFTEFKTFSETVQ